MLISPNTLVQKTDFRSNLSLWLQKAQAGNNLLISDRGKPIAVVIPWKKTSQNLDQDFKKLAQSIDYQTSPWSSLKTLKQERQKRSQQLN